MNPNDTSRRPKNPFQKVKLVASPNFDDGNSRMGTSDPFGGFGADNKISFQDDPVPSSMNRTTAPPRRNPFAKQEEMVNDQINNIINNPLARMGYEYTTSKFSEFVKLNQNAYQGYIFNNRLRYYFDLDQSLILRKLGFIVFPFFLSQDPSATTLDFLRPELYLPTMSLLTFVMLSCLSAIFQERPFNPESIVNEVTQCLMITILEASFTKLAFFVALQISVPFLDLLSYCSYKYTG